MAKEVKLEHGMDCTNLYTKSGTKVKSVEASCQSTKYPFSVTLEDGEVATYTSGGSVLLSANSPYDLEYRQEVPEESGGTGLDRQVGGSHYKEMGLEPLEACYLRYGIEGLKASIHVKVDKYMRVKNDPVQDLEKAIHCLEILRDKYKEG